MSRNVEDARFESLRAREQDSQSHGSETTDSEEKDHLLNHVKPFLRRRRFRTPSWHWMAHSVMLGLVVMLLVERVWPGQTKAHRFEFAGDVTGFAPEFRQKVLSFAPDPRFMPEDPSEFFTDEVKEEWLSIAPKGLGYLNIPDSEEFDNMPTPLVGYPEDKFVVTSSVTHQLHCLYAIAETYAKFATNRTLSYEVPWHLGHCVDYIRQGIMCCGDVALEGEQTSFPDGIIGSDGWDATHVCKDYTQVYNYLEDNAVDDQKWISGITDLH